MVGLQDAALPFPLEDLGVQVVQVGPGERQTEGQELTYIFLCV